MHGALYVCIPRSQASTSLRARKAVCRYLNEEGFALQCRFGGHCDYFSVGGRWSGRLSLLRLQHEYPKKFGKFWKQYEACETTKAAQRLFKSAFPEYQGPALIERSDIDFYGEQDDAQIMDATLFRQLRKGFGEVVTYAWEITEPNVIFTDDPDDDFEWPKGAKQAAEFWTVVIDYHH